MTNTISETFIVHSGVGVWEFDSLTDALVKWRTLKPCTWAGVKRADGSWVTR